MSHCAHTVVYCTLYTVKRVYQRICMTVIEGTMHTFVIIWADFCPRKSEQDWERSSGRIVNYMHVQNVPTNIPHPQCISILPSGALVCFKTDSGFLWQKSAQLMTTVCGTFPSIFFSVKNNSTFWLSVQFSWYFNNCTSTSIKNN